MATGGSVISAPTFNFVKWLYMTFVPGRNSIVDITNANPGVITTGSDHLLSTGQIVRLHVPQSYGMYQLNNVLASVTVLSSTTFSIQKSQIPPAINIDTTNFPAFTIPAKPGFTAEIVCAGSGPTLLTNTPVEVQNNVCDSLIGDQTVNNSTVEIPF